MKESKAEILVSWDGREEPLNNILIDSKPEFDLIIFDYSGTFKSDHFTIKGIDALVLSAKTQCKGDIYNELATHLKRADKTPSYIGLFDDDVVTSISEINRLLHIGRCYKLDVFSASLSHDSEYTHRWMLRVPNQTIRMVEWVEVMMPIYNGDLFIMGADHYKGNISSWGIDKYLIPALQKIHGKQRTAIVDAVMASHIRPITSGKTVFRNGLTAKQEGELLKTKSIGLIHTLRPDLVDGDWYRMIYHRRHARTRGQQISAAIGRTIRKWLDASS